ncbi:MAG: hypothetical protein LWW93_15955 [Hyphomicrobiales bacterium]|nr:hypothetical protein [Hyphomicrobiales bacterium]
MIFHPPILALIGASGLSAVVLGGAGLFAGRLLAGWDPTNGSERQIGLEKTTHLVSTVVAFVLTLEAASLVLFAFNADRMAPLFVGAMCAVGTLNASVWGFPTLWAKIAVFFAAFVWLAVDRVDLRARDWALIRPKYAGLLILAPLVLAEAGFELAYFLDLKADTITSCCGKLFGEDKPALGGDLAALDPRVALWALGAALVAAIGLGFGARRRRWAAVALGPVALAAFGVAIAAVISAIAPYVYEQPHHHCPFCILKREYGHVGFALYLPLFVATGAGLAAAIVAALPGTTTSRATIRTAIGGLAKTSAIGFTLFGAIAAALVWRSGLALIG